MRGYKLPDINRVPVGTKPDLVDLAKVRSDKLGQSPLDWILVLWG